MGSGWFAVGAVAGALGVVLGAFGAHGLKARVEPRRCTTRSNGSLGSSAFALGRRGVSDPTGTSSCRSGAGPRQAAASLALISHGLINSNGIYVSISNSDTALRRTLAGQFRLVEKLNAAVNPKGRVQRIVRIIK